MRLFVFYVSRFVRELKSRRHSSVLWIFYALFSGCTDSVIVYVSMNGSDTNIGSLQKPFQSLEGARNYLRKQQGGSKVVYVREGSYKLASSLNLTSEDSNTSYQSFQDEIVKVVGSSDLKTWDYNLETDISERLPSESLGKVVKIDLKKNGVYHSKKMLLGGGNSSVREKTYPFRQLFVNGEEVPISRWPRDNYENVTKLKEVRSLDGSLVSMKIGYAGEVPSEWSSETNVLIHGYFKHLWADSYEVLDTIDFSEKAFVVSQPQSYYGFGDNAKFYALNILAEIRRRGDWAFVPENESIYVFLPKTESVPIFELSTLEEPLVKMDGVSSVSMSGLIFEKSAGDGIVIINSHAVEISNNTIKNISGNAITIDGGSGHTVYSNDLSHLGRGGIKINSGDRRALIPSQIEVNNNHIHHTSKIDFTYTQGIKVDGVGTTIKNNYLHHLPSSAMRINGNDHLIEFNEIHRVMLDTTDQGAIDMWADPTYRGNVFRYNFFHHLGSYAGNIGKNTAGWAAVRLDDAISGSHVFGNIFYKISSDYFGAVQIHGGKENRVENNVFHLCSTAISFNSWTDTFWQAYTKPFYDFYVDNRRLYDEKYSSLQDFNGNLNKNTFRTNVSFGVVNQFLRNSESLTDLNNIVINDDPSTESENTSVLLTKFLRESNVIHFEEIDTGKMGLYKGRKRDSIPIEQIKADRE